MVYVAGSSGAHEAVELYPASFTHAFIAFCLMLLFEVVPCYRLLYRILLFGVNQTPDRPY